MRTPNEAMRATKHSADPALDPRISAVQRLAMRVIRLAIDDATARRALVADRADARRFLQDRDGSLDWWLETAGFPPHVRAGICERIARVLDENARKRAPFE